MTVIVKGHGSREDDRTTFVPTGTTLRFYSDFDVDISQNVELIAIANGTKATAKETIAGTGNEDDVANYQFGTVDDEFVARWLAMGGEAGIPIHFVGGDLIDDNDWLCDDPDNCSGTHTCTGVLGKLKDETDIVILACRGYVGDEEDEPELEYGADATNPLHDIEADTDEYVERILALAKTDPDAAESEVDSLPQGSLALMINRIDYFSWQEARHLKDYAEAADFEQVIGQLRAAKDLNEVMKWLNEVPSYGAAVDQAIVGNAVSFADAYNNAPSDAVLNALRQRTAVDVAVRALQSDWQPDDDVLSQVTTKNSENLKAIDEGDTGDVFAGGLLVLLGDGHGTDVQEYVQRQGDLEQGTFVVKKGSLRGVGSVTFTGIASKQALVKQAVESFSKKAVKFE